MFVFYAVLLSLVLTIVLRWILDLWREHNAGEFRRIYSRENKARLEALVLAVDVDTTIVGGYVRGARERWQESREEAIRRLDLACAHIEEAAPYFLKTLRAMRNMARTVAIVAPPKPLSLAAYKLWQTRGLAGLTSLLHWIAVTGRDRIRVRVWFLGRAFRAVVRILTGAISRSRLLGLWDKAIDDAVDDMASVQTDAVTTYELILAALDHWEADRRTHAEAV